MNPSLSYANQILASVRSMTAEDFDRLMKRPGRPASSGLELLSMAANPPPGASSYFKKASIASKLVPLLDPLLGADSILRVVGSNRPNLTQRDYPWKSKLPEWANQGVQVRMLMLDPSEEAVRVLHELQSETPDQIKIWTAASEPSAPTDTETRLWLRELESTHFVSVENPSLLWFESYHLPGSIQADHCRFYSQDSTYGRALAHQLNERFDGLIASPQVSQLSN